MRYVYRYHYFCKNKNLIFYPNNYFMKPNYLRSKKSLKMDIYPLRKFAALWIALLAIPLFATSGLFAQTVTQTIYVDFGADNDASRGMQTTGADINGNYWTNVHCTGTGDANKYIYPGTTFDIVNSDNQSTGYQIGVNVRFSTNGKSGGGGLVSPDANLIGDLAIASATEDYAFPEAHQDYVYITFRGLDRNKAYRFSSFGSRTSTADRIATFIFQGENIWSGDHQMSGTGIGADGKNANTSNILVSEPVFPDREGNITMTLVKLVKNGYVHLNAMKIEELDGLSPINTELSLAQKIFIDLGENNSDTRGHQTLGSDKNGNTWNNIYPASGNTITSGTQVSLVNSANAATGATATIGSGFKTNGMSGGGGLVNPTSPWLGELGIATATEDYAFLESGDGSTLTLDGLNKDNCYKMYFFGSRSTGTDRDYYITLNGQQTWNTLHITSGSNIGGSGVNGNTMNVSVSDYLYPDAEGKIVISITRKNSMAHLNAMKIEEYQGGSRPSESISLASLAITGDAVEGGTAEMIELQPNGSHTGVFETYVQLTPGTYVLTGTTTDNVDVTLGQGAEAGTFAQGGNAFTATQTQVARVKVDATAQTITLTPVEVVLKGEVVPANTTLAYAGNGVWRSTVNLNQNTTKLFVDRTFYFTFNGTDALAIKRVPGSANSLAMPSEGFSAENLRVNNGTYDITVDMRNYTFAFDAPIDAHKISVFGSSVSNGQGATNNHGYAYMYDELLQTRVADGLSSDAFRISSVAINGNSTVNLLNRYDDLTRDFGKYVIFGLSLGNEGIHGASNQDNIFAQFRDNMQTLIGKVRTDGKVPVVMNNYTRTDFTSDDYSYIKRMNLLIHEWDLPSVNMLGAIDDGTGKWATGYQNPGDIYHPTTDGHREFYYAMVPSLFDALAAGKPLPVRDMTTSLTLKDKSVIEFEGEETIHPFALSIRVKGNQEGRIASFATTTGNAYINVGADGKVTYVSPTGSTIQSTQTIDNADWHHVTVSHYWAQQRTLLFVDGTLGGEISERLSPSHFTVGDDSQATERQFSELFFWRSALNADEVQALTEGKMLKSSLDIYATLSDGETTIANKAQSMNTVNYTEGTVEGLAGIWLIGADGSIGKPNYTEGDGWHTENAIRMESMPGNIYKVDLTVGTSLNKDFVNFKFFGQAGWGIEFTGASDATYHVTSDSEVFGVNESGNVYLKDGQTLAEGDTYIFFMDCSQGTDKAVMHVEKRVNSVNGLWMIGANGSIGEPNYTEGVDWDTNKAIKLTEDEPGIYSYTFEVGKTLNKDFVNFKFFGQAGWGIEFHGTGTTPYLLTSTSNVFLVGDGTGGHDNGNIYLASGETLEEGDEYTFMVNMTQGADKAVLSVSKVEKVILDDIDGLWIIGATGSVGDPTYGEGTDWQTSRAIQMTEVSPKVYEHVFVVGESLNKSFVNFKFFGQAGWGIEFQGSLLAPYHITSLSDVFLVGDGDNGHDNGNIYLASGQTLTDGDEYLFRVDMTKGYGKAELTVVKTIVLDETVAPVDLPTSGVQEKVALLYTAKQGWNTVCVPFALQESDLTALFGDGCKAYEFYGYENNELKFRKATSLSAGTPYVVYADAPATVGEEGYIVRDVEFAETAPQSYGGASFVGTFSPIAAPNMAGLYGVVPSTGHIQKGGTGASIKGFRAYFQLPATADASNISMNFDGEIITGISMVQTADTDASQVYDIAGRKAVEKSLRKGVYIKNGRKYIVK